MRSRFLHRFRKPYWHLETFACSCYGHVAPAAGVRQLREQDAGLGIDIAEGRLCRCLRCDVWLLRTVAPINDHLPPLDQLALPRRGKSLKQALIIRVIALDKILHSIIFTLVFLTLLIVQLKFPLIRADLHKLLRVLQQTPSETGQNPSADFLTHLSRRVLSSDSTVKTLLVTSGIYAVMEGVEAVGLWREKHWAEYLTVVATAGFIPFEIYELSERITVLRLLAFLINMAIVIWLIWAKRLFCLRGGRAADRATAPDPDQLFANPTTSRELPDHRLQSGTGHPDS